MGFEHRKAVRIKAAFHLYFWLGLEESGAGVWAQADNLSETGMAFRCPQALDKGQPLMLELSLPDKGKALRVQASVLRDEPQADGQHLVRALFTAMDGDAQMRLQQYVLAVADPKLAAATGWGKAYFQDQHIHQARYRELPPGLKEKWLAERSYLDIKGLVYLKAFQAHLEGVLGERLPGAFKLLGSRALKEKAVAWLELQIDGEPFHLLAESIWCEQEAGERAVVGLQAMAFHKDEALRIEKGL